MARRYWRKKPCQGPSVCRVVTAHVGAWLPVQQSSEWGLLGSDCTITTLPSLGGVKARLYYRKTARSGRWGPSWKKWFPTVLEGWEGQKSRCQSEVRTAELMCFVGSFEKKLLPQSGLFTLLSSPTVYPLAAKSIFRESAPWRRHPCPQTLVAEMPKIRSDTWPYSQAPTDVSAVPVSSHPHMCLHCSSKSEQGLCFI